MAAKRLTERKENGSVQYEDRNGYYHTFHSGNDGDPVHAVAWKLAELEDKLEQGQLIRLDKVMEILDKFAVRLIQEGKLLEGDFYEISLYAIDDILSELKNGLNTPKCVATNKTT